MPESIQHKLDRVRRPRVQITYDVETLGSIVKTQLPFVVGIMADLSGNAISKNQNPTLLKDRKFVEIDRDNFDTIMEKLEPTVKVKGNDLTFRTLEDFAPINVLRSVSDISKKFDSRTRLSNLVAKLDGNVALQKEFIAAYKELHKSENVAAKTALETYFDVVKNPPPPPGTMRITPAETTGVTQTATGLVVTLNPDDAAKAKLFKITEIKGGKVSGDKKDIKGDGTVAVEAVKEGFKFTPEANSTAGSFKVTALDKDNNELSSETATITVKKVEGGGE